MTTHKESRGKTCVVEGEPPQDILNHQMVLLFKWKFVDFNSQSKEHPPSPLVSEGGSGCKIKAPKPPSRMKGEGGCSKMHRDGFTLQMEVCQKNACIVIQFLIEFDMWPRLCQQRPGLCVSGAKSARQRYAIVTDLLLNCFTLSLTAWYNFIC